MRGVTPELFYGTWAATGNGDAGENPLVRHAGLNDCLTVYGLYGAGDVTTALVTAGVIPDPGQQPGAAPAASTSFITNMLMGGSAIVTLRSTARLRLSNGQLSDMRRTVGTQVKLVPFGSESPFYTLRWYDTAWSY